VGIVLLLAVILAAVLVPPALRAHAARQEAFLVSLGSAPASEPALPRSVQVQRRRRIAGGLLLAMAGTLIVGLLPTFRVLLVVHLFLVDAFIAYIGLLAYSADRAARMAEVVEPVDAPAPAPARRWRRPAAVLGELAPVG
jgi:hypothetical protein